MQSLYLWPDNPILSIFVLWLGSAIFLWAARTHVLKLMAQLGTELGGGIMYNQVPHQVDACRYIAGGMVKSVRAATFRGTSWPRTSDVRRTFWIFGSKRRLVARLEWDPLCPK